MLFGLSTKETKTPNCSDIACYFKEIRILLVRILKKKSGLAIFL